MPPWSTHGAHLPFLGLDPYAGADAVVMSAHKTLPAMGQTALLFTRGLDPDLVRLRASMYGSSSPSYPMMASLDAAREWLLGPGKGEYDRVARRVAQLRRRFPSVGAGDGKDLPWDPTRLTVKVKNGPAFARALEAENYMQRFAPLFHGVRLRCAEVLALCRPELDALSGGQEPARGWLAYTYDFACRLLFPEEDADTSCAAGAVFFLSVLQVLFAAEDELLPRDPAWTFDFPTEEELSGCACAASLGQMLRSWKREYVYELMRLGLEATPYRTLEHIAGVHHVAMTAARGLRRAGIPLDLALVSGSAAGHDIGKFGCPTCTTTTPTCGSAAAASPISAMWPPTTPSGIWSRTICRWNRCC